MAGEITLPPSDVAAVGARTVADLKPHEDAPAFTEAEAREMTEQVRVVSGKLDEFVAQMYIGKVHLSLGYATWSQYLDGENLKLEFRPSLAQRRDLHYHLYWITGMSGREVARFSGFDQKTVTADATYRHEELLGAGQESPLRPRMITDKAQRARAVPEQRHSTDNDPPDPSEQVSVSAVAADIDAGDDDAPDECDVIEAEDVTETLVSEVEPVLLHESPPMNPLRGRTWPDAFMAATLDMRTQMRQARGVLSDEQLKTHLSGLSAEAIEEWGSWAEEMLLWYQWLMDAPED